MKKILVPVDFSEYAEYALEVAASMAKRWDAEIVVLHMMGLSEAVFTKDESQEAAEAYYYMKLARKRFETFLDKPYLKGLKISEVVQNYKIFTEISKVAGEKQIDLIIMGSHGTGGMSEIFVGSNTEKVVRTADIPVLVIKQRTSGFHPKQIVFACDYKLENLKTYHKAMQLFKDWGADVYLVHVNQPNFNFKSSKQIQKEVNHFINEAHGGELPGNTRQVFVADYTVEQGVFNYAEEIEADLIAVPTHGRSGLAHFFRGSIGEAIANHAPKPVITFRV